MGIKGADEAAEVPAEQKDTAQGAPDTEAPPPPEDAKKGKKKKEKTFDPLSDDAIKFKKIDFDNALTDEEKAAKKAEKLAAKKGGKAKKIKPPKEENPSEPPPPEPEEPKKKGEGEAEAAPKEETAKGAKKGKKSKKGAKEEVEAAPPSEVGEVKEAGEVDEAALEEEAKKGKKQKGKKTEEKAAAEEVVEGKEAKPKKGKKKKEAEVEEIVGEEGKDVAKKGKKGKKEKGKKVKDEAETEGVEVAEGVEGEVVPEKKGKKGKGKGKKGKKGLEETTEAQMDVSAFLEHYASLQLDDDEWTWESYTPSSESLKEVTEKGKGKGKGKDKKKKGKKGKGEKEEEGEKKEGEAAEALPVEEKAEKKGKGKGKKGKKGKKGEKEAPESVQDAVPAETDIMAEINKMKALADAQIKGDAELGEETLEPKKGKKGKKKKDGEGEDAKGEPKAKKEKEQGPKKKLSKKERAKLAAEQAEQARIQAELDAKQAEEEERIRLIEERKAAIEKEKRETAEQYLRTEQLNNSLNMIGSVKKNNIKKALKDKDEREWEQFLKCDGLPDPYVCGQMNCYLHLWEKAMDSTTIDGAALRTKEALKLLNVLTTLIDDPVGVEESQIENWKWIHRLFREYQQRNLDTATYRLLRDIQKNLNRINLSTADFERKEDDFALAIWLLIRLPTCMPNPRKPPPPRIQIDFPDMRMNVLFPISLECYCMAVRAMYVKYDHLSDLCASFHKPPVPEQHSSNLYKSTLSEWYSKLFYKYENRLKPEKPEGEEAAKEEVVIVDKEAGIIPIVPYQKLEPTASGYVIAEEDRMYLDVHESLVTRVEEHVINLRKYIILGGNYFLDLYYQPPQPQDVVSFDMAVSRLEIPQCVSEVPFHIKYDTPPPIDPADEREAGEIEKEIKKQEEELDQLLFFTLTLPQHIMWLDVPTICQWDKERQLWTTEDVHDLKHIEEKGYITFRTARFGCFGLAAYRYMNLPYQAWELKPELDGTVTLQITAAILMIEFNIKDNLISVVQLQNSPNKALREIVGIYYKLPKLIRILQEGGVDVFPAFDAFCYIEGTCEKHWPMEKHTYCMMAQLSGCYNFAWSRWNLPAGRRNLVMQMREYKPDKVKQVSHSMLMVTPLKAMFIECTEVSQVFNDEGVEGMHFYSDLYHLMKGTSGMATRTKVQSTPHSLVGAVARLLKATRVMSFS